MSKYDRDIQDVYAVKQLGDAIGYGHLMAIAHELWARHLESKGLPRRGAHCVVGYPMVKEQFQAEALNDKIYTIIVGKALEADRKTENSSEKPNNCTDCEHWSDTEDGCADRHGCRATTEGSSTVPTSSILEQVDKDINVRSKDEAQTCSVNGRPYTDCCNCEYFKCTADEPYEYEIKALHKGYVEPYVTIEDEPQTERGE